ncbi:MAG: leucine-rich repeat domain-containing protein [Promethearchaeota archaeon]
MDKVYQEFSFSSAEELVEALNDWKLDKYFDITGTFVVRNENPTCWDSLKKNLKKAGKWALTKCVPVAIGIATGGLGLGTVAAPAVSEILNKLRNRGLNISKDVQDELENILLNKTDASIEELMKKLIRANEGGSIDPDKLKRLIRLSIKEDLHPFLAEIQAVLGTLQQEQEHLTLIFEDWTLEQCDKLEGLQEEMLEQFGFTLDGLDRIEQNLLPSLEDFNMKLSSIENVVTSTSLGIKEANNRLYAMEDKLDALYNEVCREILEELSLEELFQASRIQFQNMRLAGKFDKPYDEDLFIETPRLLQDFMNYLRQKQNTTPVFLLLSSVGMGKTWNAVHLGVQSRNSLLSIPFFVPIHMGYGEILKDSFQIIESSMAGLARIIGEKCERICSNTKKRVLFIFDGIDEYPAANREPFLNFLRHLLQGYKHAVRILLTDRTTDWCENKQLRGFYRDISHLVWSNTELKGVCNLYKIATPLSGFLDGFTDSQLNRAIIQYGLDKEKFPSKLYDLCHKPYILRIMYEREQYFDPDNVGEFWGIFYDQLNPVNTILDRMGISNPNELLFPLFEAFGSASAVKSERDLKNSIERNQAEWEVILRSGLLQTVQQRFQVVYKFDPVFYPIITDYLAQVGKLAETEVSTTIQKPPPEPSKTMPSTLDIKGSTTQVSETQKKLDYFISLGKKYIDSKSYHDALANLQKARTTCDEELFDPELLVEIDGLIRQVEAQEKKGAEEKKIVSFRRGQIPQFEADLLQELESQLGEQFTLVNKVEWYTQMGFSAESNRISGIGLYKCWVSNLPASITKLEKLKVLNIRYNHLRTLPKSIGNLTSLTFLNLESNKISTLPESIGQLSSLQRLELQLNQLLTLPESIGNLSSLQTLSLEGNKLTTLPESIGQLSSLKELRLNSNQLSTLPESIGQLSSMQYLYVNNNQLTTLPESMINILSLKSLYVSGNQLDSRAKSVLKQLKKKGVSISTRNFPLY